jgi:succinyl-CoA synthetase alpha subunit
MAIFVDNKTRLIVHGITGGAGAFHTRQMVEYGTKVVGGVTPGKGGQKMDNIPVFDTAKNAYKETGANASVIFVPAPFCKDAIVEAIDAGAGVVVTITEGIPTMDMLAAKKYADEHHVRLIGPNCPGIISPGQCKIGIMPGYIHKPGHVGVVSRSGTLTYEAVGQLTALDIGQSTCLGIGGDPVIGTNFIDALNAFQQDPETEAVVMMGEIGGSSEEQAAAFVKAKMTKPVVAFIAGKMAPPGKRMGHAGAIISGGKGTAAEKIQTLEANGIAVAETPAVIGKTLAKAIGRA